MITKCFPGPDLISFLVNSQALTTAVGSWIQHMPDLGRRILGLSLNCFVELAIVAWPVVRATNSGDLLGHGLKQEVVNRVYSGLVRVLLFEVGRGLLILSRHSHPAKVSFQHFSSSNQLVFCLAPFYNHLPKEKKS